VTKPIAAYDLGRVPYRKALEMQRRAVADRAAGTTRDSIWFVEHDPVLTLGRASHSENLLLSESTLRARGVEVVSIERGGDVTYHGPGQIVAYPIVALDGLPGGRDMHRYLRDLEDVLIGMLASYGIAAGRRSQYTGVWVGDRKVAAIGVAVRRWITFHGFALNLDPDLSHFEWIHPCGIRDLGVTSMRALLGEAPARGEVLGRVRKEFARVWNRPVVEKTWEEEALHA